MLSNRRNEYSIASNAKNNKRKQKTLPKSKVHCVVRHIDLSWNTLEPSLVLMHQKLTDLGWVFYNGEIHIVEPETEESKHHV